MDTASRIAINIFSRYATGEFSYDKASRIEARLRFAGVLSIPILPAEARDMPP